MGSVIASCCENGCLKGCNFSSRMRRRDFWIFIITSWSIYIPFFIYLLNGPENKSDSVSSFYWMMISLMTLIIFTISATVRRLHDVGKSGCFSWIFLFPPFSLIVIYFLLLDSEKEINQWGSSPKYPSSHATKPYTPYVEPEENQQPIVNDPKVVYIKETKVYYIPTNAPNPYPYLPPQPDITPASNDIYVNQVSETYEP
jgi:uncharacterized membrane protein YhaH (DUF805 family)